ncbi:hypothetical protein [Rhizorhabdus sp. FW153]|uniref:hypothetical protein n=1 Tax=Rhizorhabdus sp. FW153 TaxID=3400216 RepID=UPI003CFB6CF5
MLPFLAFLMQAALPPPGLNYYGRTEYSGPGVVCGAAFSVRLRVGETAVLTKRSFFDAELSFNISDGRLTVHESKYATEGGKMIQPVGDGVLRRKREKQGYVWIYRDNAPGSTDVRGPAVSARKPSVALSRITFGSPRSGFVGAEKCLDGSGSDKRSS